MRKQDHVRLAAGERTGLTDLISAGRAAARAQTHARILLKADAGPGGPAWTDAAIAEAPEAGVRTVERVRDAGVNEGLAAALSPKPARGRRPRRRDGAPEARLVALACSAPPQGQTRWTLRLVAERLVELEVVAGIAPETVRQTLKQTRSSPG